MFEYLSQFSFVQGITFFLVFIGVVLLGTSIKMVIGFYKVLKANEYVTNRWIIIIILIFFFIVGYTVHAFDVFDFFQLPIDSSLMVSLIYFFGAVFVFMAMNSTKSLVKTILGDIITDNVAYEVAVSQLGINEEDLEHLFDSFNIHCVSCNQDVSYTIADVVRQHYKLDDKGINIESTFGVNSILLRPTHKCTKGRREIIVVHDHNLAFRAIDQSRIILGSTL